MLRAIVGSARPLWRERSWLWLLPVVPPWIVLALAGPGGLVRDLCLAPGSESLARMSAQFAALADPSALVRAAAGWLLMIAAMAPPLLHPMVQHVAVRSFRDRQARGVALFVAGYVAVAMAGFFVVVGGLVALVAATPGIAPAVTASAVAALWQVGPLKTWALRRCHRTFPLRPRGVAADLSCLAFGLRHGWFCALSCLPMMAATMAIEPHLAAMLVVAAIAVVERNSRTPRLCWSALLLLLMGLASAAFRG